MADTYFKATRPDGTDFRTGTIAYEVGKRVHPHPYDGKRIICGPGLLHAADAPGETLVGGSWPCRLFEVTGTPVAGLDKRHPHKAGFEQLVVTREIPAHRALGPQGERVAALIERASRLTRAEARGIRAARYAARDGAGDAAGRASGRASDAVGKASGAAARSAAGYAAWSAAWFAASEAEWRVAWEAATRNVAMDVAADAALALVVRDLVSATDFNALYGPWAEVIEEEA